MDPSIFAEFTNLRAYQTSVLMSRALAAAVRNLLRTKEPKDSAPLRSVTVHIEARKFKGADVIAAFCSCHKTARL